uniref:Subtilisin-like protease SBT1.7 n=1 Tax=Ananas comosus var. bracteatus TaxID=296719 RepID=A0A6V7NKT3_ANACO|nr:unnamed protein product [Ananas comosus var. bracteatus]
MYQNASSFFSLSFIVILLSIFSPVLCIRNIGSNDSEPLQTYIVRVQPPIEIADASSNELESWYKSFLSESVSDTGEPRLLHSYSEVFSGFAAKLTQFELNSMQKREGFVRAFPERKLYLQTTHTPEFLGLRTESNGLWNASEFGRGVIVGLLDTGIAAGHPSFSDAGVPLPPRGGRAPAPSRPAATTSSSARAHSCRAMSRRHGCWDGAARAPGVYKVCSASGCTDSDVLAGLDAAVKDGVDVISISLVGGSLPFDEDVIAIGAFAAFEKGIVVSCAAGNTGPFNTSLSNEAPWYITVGATSVDRSFRSYVQLNNGKVYEGESLNQLTKIPSNPVELAYNSNRSDCTFFKNFDIQGKIVVCKPFFPPEKIATAILKAGGIGVVVINVEEEGYSIIASDFPLPASQLSPADGDAVIAYASDARNNPKALITFNGTVLGTSPAPVVAFFSSRGPNYQSPSILKPDVSAPG